MIIVYLSLILVIAAVAGFVLSVRKTAGLMNGSMARIAKTGEKMREQKEKMSQEKNRLTQSFTAIQLDFYKKRERVNELTRGLQKSIHLTQENIYKVKKSIKGEK
ncbi:hypothetical protein EWI07_00180 [Sporolactobacillus sp. THM7-4]|nr:hypothetical protein EWI07_00180 [Sporolactobacillus sp. THM7-4]